MMLDLLSLKAKYNIAVSGVVQVGCHWSEEHEALLSLGAKEFVYIEPCKDAFEVISKRFSNDKSVALFNVACGDSEGSAVMYVSHDNQGQSNSLLQPDKHLEQHPNVVFNDAEIVTVKRLDNIEFDRSKYNFLMMDCQGFEGHVLLGAPETLKHIDYIYTEVNRDSTYKDNFLVEQLDELLSDFVRVETFYPSPNFSWGDAFYIKRNK